MLPTELDYVIPVNINEAVSYLTNNQNKVRIIAGGTDLVIALKKKKEQTELLIDVTRIPELKQISYADRTLRIGGAVTFTEVATNKVIMKEATALSEAAALVGSPQIRNSGTIGGNIATGSPAADSVGALTAFNPIVILCNQNGEQRVSLADLWENGKKYNIGVNTLLVGVEIPLAETSTRSKFVKLGRRNALAISRMNLTLAIAENKEGIIKWASLALGAVALHPYTLPEVNNLMMNKKLSQVDFKALEKCLVANVQKSLGNRASAQYKLEAVKQLLDEAIKSLL